MRHSKLIECRWANVKFTTLSATSVQQSHSPPTRHPPNPYALKPVPPSQTSIRSSQTKAVEIIDTAAEYKIKLVFQRFIVFEVKYIKIFINRAHVTYFA